VRWSVKQQLFSGAGSSWGESDVPSSLSGAAGAMLGSALSKTSRHTPGSGVLRCPHEGFSAWNEVGDLCGQSEDWRNSSSSSSS